MKPKKIHAEMPVKATPEEMWKVLSQFGDVSTFHAGVAESHNAEGSDNKASLGCERVCNIVDMGIPITLKERIIDYDEGRSYQFEVYEWKNFPLQEMRFRFTIREITPPDTMLAIDIEYIAKPGLLTPVMAGKMRRLAQDVLLGYKHFAETGHKRAPIRVLKKQYKGHDRLEAQYS